MVTKDGSLCGILLTSFHDETILTNPEYLNILNLISLLEVIPLQHKGHITGIIYTFLLNTTHKLSEDYFGNVSYVIEKLDSFIRKEIDEYEFHSSADVTPIVQIEPLDHWIKMVLIYKYMSEFLLKNNISTGLPIKKSIVQGQETLEDLCIRVSKCIMYVLFRLHVSDDCSKVRRAMTSCYSVLLSMFSFAPYIAVKTFPFFKRFVIYTQNRIEQTTMYGTVFGAILNIHFKLSKEVGFLEILLRFEARQDFVDNDAFVNSEACWLPVNALKTALYQVFSSVSPERMLSGWLSCVVAHFNFKYLQESRFFCDYHMYCVCTTLVCTLEVTLVNKTPLGNDTVLTKQAELLNDIKQQLGNMKVILMPKRTHSKMRKRSFFATEHMTFGTERNERLYSCFLEIATYWGMFNIMSTEYNRIPSLEKGIGTLRTGDHALYLLHDYLDVQDWRELFKIITTIHKDNIHVMNALSELLAQSVDMLDSYVNINSEYSPTEVTCKFLVNSSNKTWLLSRAHLIQPHLSTRDQWKLARKLSKHLILQENVESLLENNADLHELNVLVFEIAFCVLKQAIMTAYKEATDIGEAVVLLECQEEEIQELAINEDKKSFLKKLWKKTQRDTSDIEEDTSDDNVASNPESDNSEDECKVKNKVTEVIEQDSSDGESKTKRKCSFVEDSDSVSGSSKKRKVDKVLNSILVTFLKEIKSTELPKTDLSKYISIIEHLPVQYLEPSSQHLLFILVIICSRVSATSITPLIDSFILGKDFSIPHCDIIPFLLEILQKPEDTTNENQVLKKLCKLCVQDEDSIKVISEYCELTKKKSEDINVDLLRAQCHVTLNFLSELKCSKTSNKRTILLKKKLISRTHKNFKSLKLEPSKDILLLFTYMLQKSLKEHDSQSIQVLCDNLNAYLDIALEVEHKDLIETVLIYADLTLKKYIPSEFTSKVWNKLPPCANLCFQAASLVQFNQFLNEMFNQMSEILKLANIDPCNITSLEANFQLWRKLLSSHLSRNTNLSRLAKLETVITSLSTHISLYTRSNTEHFPMVLQLVLDIVNSQAFSCGNTSMVHSLFNLMTPKSSIYFKPCMKLLQYLITKKASIISDETAVFLLKYHGLLTQVSIYFKIYSIIFQVIFILTNHLPGEYRQDTIMIMMTR